MTNRYKIRIEISQNAITIIQNGVKSVIPILKEKIEKEVITPQAQ